MQIKKDIYKKGLPIVGLRDYKIQPFALGKERPRCSDFFTCRAAFALYSLNIIKDSIGKAGTP